MKEKEIQKTIIEYLRVRNIRHYSIPNGFWVPGLSKNRLFAYIRSLKDQGLSPGVPDICIPYRRQGYGGLYIEVKTKSGKVSNDQQNWIAFLETEYLVAVCRDVASAIETITQYFEDK